MLYTNTKLVKTEKEMDWGTLIRFEIGETGRGRNMICLPCGPDTPTLDVGLHSQYSIGATKTGRPRINHTTDNDLYLMLSAQGGYTRRGNGTIQVLNGSKELITVLARGNGADGAAGRIGYWDCMLLKAPIDDFIFRVRTSGGGYGTPSDLYIIHQCAVYHCTPETLEQCCDSLGINIPCYVNHESGECFLAAGEWSIL